jgi:O-antigen ligase
VADAHSTLLDALAETGFLGGALFLMFPLTLVVLGVRRSRRLAGPERALLAALTTAYAAGTLMHLTYSYAYFPFEWVLAGCVGAMVATSVPREAAVS